jgi:hypothetical protein
MPALARTASNVSVNCPARSRARIRRSAGRSPGSIRRVRICWLVRGPSGWAVTPGKRAYRGLASMTKRAGPAPGCHRAVQVEEAGGEDGGGLGVRELPPGHAGVRLRRCGIRRALRARRMVEAPARWPSLASSITPTCRLCRPGGGSCRARPHLRRHTRPMAPLHPNSLEAALPQRHRATAGRDPIAKRPTWQTRCSRPWAWCGVGKHLDDDLL